MNSLHGDEFSEYFPQKLVMVDPDPEDLDDFFLEAPPLDYTCDTDDCPPPVFMLPPPPRPPDLGEGCPALSPYESCDNIVIIDSQVHLEETFQNLIIVAVSSAILVIVLVLLVACIWRRRKSGREGCNCGEGKQENHQSHQLPPETLEMKTCSEVYDNPNYSHIMIGGKPFFILPTGELSEHVPVPVAGEQHTPRHTQPHHIYEGGSSTYRSGSDYDTESSTYRPDSDRASNGFPPIYEEIDKCSSAGGSNRNSQAEREQAAAPSQLKGFVPVQTLAVIRKEESLPQTILQSDRGPWTSHKSLSPRRPATRLPNRTSDSSSVYYYSDTLRRRGLMPDSGRDSVQESDSGVSSRSGHNTSSESTPQPRLDLSRSLRGLHHQPVLSSEEDISLQDRRHERRGFSSPARGAQPCPVDTQIIVRNTSRREPRANL